MKAITVSMSLLLSAMIFGQYEISGMVTDESGEPLLGVNVYLKGTYTGATTDVDGNFSFTVNEEDHLILVASFIGYHVQEIPLEPKSQKLDIQLRVEINQLNAVVITAGSFNVSDGSKKEVLKPLDIVTTAGATADIPGALNTLPGTQQVGETGRLFVRGGEDRETKTFIDGMLVHNEYSPSAPNTPGRSRFSPFMFKGTSFSTGGYSAEYGQALSSALILESKDVGGSDRIDLSLMTVGADIAMERSFDSSSFAGKIQYSNLTPYFALVSQNLDWDKAPQEYSGNFTYRLKTGKTGLLKLYTNLSTSDLELYEAEITDPEINLPVKVTNDYAYVNASYRTFLNDKWTIRTGASFTKSSDFASLDEASREQDLVGYHTKVVADYLQSDRMSLILGEEVIGRNLHQELIDGEPFKQHLHERISATFSEAELYISTDLAFKIGGRLEHSNLSNRLSLDPRISAAYKIGENSQISFAYGRFRQLSSDQIILFDQDARQEKAIHYISNYQWIKEGQTFRIEGYEKRYNHLTRYENIFDPTTYLSDGSGHARGVDLFWRDSKTFHDLDYWISYSYLQTERNYRDFPGSFTPSFASTHNFSIVTKKFIDKIKSQVGLTYSFASARPYNDLNGERFMSGRTPSYHDLSFNISYLYNNQVIIHAMVNNALGANNIFGYEYADEPGSDGIYASRPITPAAKRFIFLGIFITLSKNKGISQLPNL
ncbi:MAG: carboxypeptidase-like regulatory domain-containing protein [Bacteroidota bacterium]